MPSLPLLEVGACRWRESCGDWLSFDAAGARQVPYNGGVGCTGRLMLKFKTRGWRFDSPGRIPGQVESEFSDLIGKMANQGDAQDVLEHFKSYFASAAGITSTSWSSSISWAQTDLQNYMEQAAENAPLFIEAFYDGCESLRKKDIDVPDLKVINRSLRKHDAGYEIQPPYLISHISDDSPVEVPDEPASLDQQAREIIQASLSQSEELLSEGKSRPAVQEILWLLESVSTVFQGIKTEKGTVQGKYFNKIVEDLRKHNQGTTLDQVLDWIVKLHGYLSSTTGGGIRHGAHLKSGVATKPQEARLFCNLIRSYILFLIAEHQRLTGSGKGT